MSCLKPLSRAKQIGYCPGIGGALASRQNLRQFSSFRKNTFLSVFLREASCSMAFYGDQSPLSEVNAFRHVRVDFFAIS